MSDTTITATPDEGMRPEPQQAACQNCGTPLLGEHCYRCGQPVKGLVRHFSSIIGDFLDSVLNIDARVFRTLWPLFSKPGYLSHEYFEGRRVRYVSPVRLFVFLSIVTFFVAQFTLDFSGVKMDGDGNNDAIASAKTVQEVVRNRDATLAELQKAHRDTGDVPGVSVGLDAAATAIRAKADRRIAELKAVKPGDAARNKAPEQDNDEDLSFNGKPWDARTNPIKVPWFPDFANRKLNEMAGHAKENVHRMQRDPNLLKDAVLSVVPSTLFVLMPIFALMLKIVYAFRRRLYMEHLIVALHSHAFLCLSLLLVFLLMALEDALAPALHGVFKFLQVLLWVWMPVYLLLMQKRVYGQGWAMTVLKYCLLGFCYFILLSFGAAFTMLAGLVWM
ncbi:hypothetical protein LYSHEL_10430 [Lysobacter helvus]|uniref:DUF3667 domain-containing protein n=2 Tax=Lysobacteraceae TaxID=32033 RepID=A0ABN6FRH7_9GAMM|nr:MULTISPECIES: DUF3667 domain-containing protein [Lysobacter]BCT92019.1 hypothetical protein LYSCAS_10430 [Lysobacter caseinilyticus]BCT95172.1 hypothetical protein LYSHEL_10430 [Lysobacter helvus]